MRERFPADTPLSHVVEYIAGRHPSLPAFSLLQGFPRKRFGESELACSLRSLGLTPNAALCIQTTPPETPQDPTSPASQLGVVEQAEVELPELARPPTDPPQEEAGLEDDLVVPPPLPRELWEEAVGYAGIPGVEPPFADPAHRWGKKYEIRNSIVFIVPTSVNTLNIFLCFKDEARNWSQVMPKTKNIRKMKGSQKTK